jgi:hypothetical protein
MMQQPDGGATTEQIIGGLLTANTETLQQIYSNFRPDCLRAIAHAGGSSADGGVFFQAAIIEAARMAHAGTLPADLVPANIFRALSLAHFQAWKNSRLADTALHLEEDLPDWLPDESQIKNTRNAIYVWKKISRLDKNCQEALTLGGALNHDDPCAQKLANALQHPGSTTEGGQLSHSAQQALLDAEGLQLWREIRVLEQRIADGLPLDGHRPQRSKVAQYLFLALFLLGVSMVIWAYFNRPRNAGEVFDENYEAPHSFLADLERRYQNDSTAAERPAICAELLREADEFYQKKNFEAAAQSLLVVIENTEAASCHADANFFLGVVMIELGEPADALRSFSSIDNVEAYGEDLYWYQALAFVKMAQQRPGMGERARRALKRFLENTRDENRRQQAEKMLKELGG